VTQFSSISSSSSFSIFISFSFARNIMCKYQEKHKKVTKPK
jgi:hypothetical protein